MCQILRCIKGRYQVSVFLSHHQSLQDYDKGGSKSTGTDATSHFKFIVNKRIQQGFTVYQTQPNEVSFDFSDGINIKDIAGLKIADKYFKYIAKMGLVHANAQFFFASTMNSFIMKNYSQAEYEKLLDTLSRYWVAHFGAFPCLWTLGQEVDNDFYYKECSMQNQTMTVENNPYKKVCELMYKYDPLKQPISAHQEGSYYIGKYTTAVNSAFRDIKGHTWWANQWKPNLNQPIDFSGAMDYWAGGQGKPAVMYEGRYEGLWTNEYGARAQGWLSFLNGMFGHGYGAVDIWLYKSTYDIEKPTHRDGLIMSVEDKLMPWGKSIDLPGGIEMAYMKEFFEKLEWWKLEPCFDLNEYFVGDHGYYSASHIGNDLYVAYFYDKVDDVFTKSTGTFLRLDKTAKYVYQWYDPTKNVYLEEKEAIIKDGTFKIEERPTLQDWVITLKKVK